MPASIPPGPGNPLGTRAMSLNASGILIHGTYASYSVGTYASHGCIRMLLSDVEALYPQVPVGTPVLIHR
jgi:L,D-transpeptidase ErfK/SrfK